MEENQTVVEETMEDIEESSAETIPNDSVPPATENSEESGEDTVIDNPQDNIDVSESVESTEETTEETTEEEIEEETTEEETTEIEADMDVLELLALMDEETETQVPFLEKPINEYSVSEGLLLLIFILGLVAFIYHVVFD